MPRISIFSPTSTANFGRLFTDGGRNFTFRLKEIVAGSGITITDDTANNELRLDVMAAGITQLTGDVTAGPGVGSQASVIGSGVVTNGKLAQMAAHTIKGNNTGSTATPLDLTATQVTAELNAVVGDSGAGGTKGLVPAPAAGDAAAGKYLDAAGAFSVPAGGGGTGVQVATVTVTDAEFRALNTVPKLVLAAQGAKKVIVVYAFAFAFENTGAFSVGPSLNVRYVTSSLTAGISAVNTNANNASGKRYGHSTNGVTALAGTVGYDNNGIEVFASASSTGGSTTGGFAVTVWYSVLTMP